LAPKAIALDEMTQNNGL